MFRVHFNIHFVIPNEGSMIPVIDYHFDLLFVVHRPLDSTSRHALRPAALRTRVIGW